MNALLIPLLLATLAGDAETCSIAEAATYEARGWDTLECDGDKAWSADANWATFPAAAVRE